MPDFMQETEGGVLAPAGFVGAGVRSDIKKSGKRDLAVIASEQPAAVAAVFTRNKVRAAPVVVSEKNTADGSARAVLANSGNANACTGRKGIEDAMEMARVCSTELGISEGEVVLASTGVIGELLPMERVTPGIRKACQGLSADAGDDIAEAIMTTDTYPKQAAVKLVLDAGTIHIGIVAKGSGMIRPDMATMLAFLTTDARVDSEALQTYLSLTVDHTFNSITVDGETSTNDMVVILANGASGVAVAGEDRHRFFEGLEHLCSLMAREIVRDGEGATKFVEVQVTGAVNARDARKAAFAVADSNLVKTAVFGGDPNWGRVVAALGYSGVELDPEKVTVKFGPFTVVKNGTGAGALEEDLSAYLQREELTIACDLNMGKGCARVWTADLSYDYVRINAEYRT